MHKELMIFESRRKKLLLMMLIMTLLLFVVTVIMLQLHIFALTLFLPIPWLLLTYFFKQRIERFKDAFKPLVVRLLLQYMQHDLMYHHRDFISKDTFLRARIFPVKPDVYQGEDYIMGKVGTLFFEMSELKIFKTSTVRKKVIKWFEGLFFHVNFNANYKGRLVIIPKADRQDFIPVFKNITKYGGFELTDTGYPDFDALYSVYTDANAPYEAMLSQQIIQLIYNFYQVADHKVYASFMDSHFYLAINESRNLLEASLLQSNGNFERIVRYYEELEMFTQMIENIDTQQ